MNFNLLVIGKDLSIENELLKYILLTLFMYDGAAILAFEIIDRADQKTMSKSTWQKLNFIKS